MTPARLMDAIDERCRWRRTVEDIIFEMTSRRGGADAYDPAHIRAMSAMMGSRARGGQALATRSCAWRGDRRCRVRCEGRPRLFPSVVPVPSQGGTRHEVP
jgi:hypothetical protein